MSSLEQAPTRVGERSASPGLVGAQVARTEASDDQWPVGSFGPVAVGANLVADRWTLLVVREMLEGATRFNEIHRGLPCLSRSLLTSRLRHLERLGLVARVPVVGGSRADYLLTPSGRALSTVVDALGSWARDWAMPGAGAHEPGTDASAVLWRFFRALDMSAVPSRGVNIEFRFIGGVPSQGWIRADRRMQRAGLGHPEGAVDLVVTASAQVLDELWSGARQCDPTIEEGEIAFDGPDSLARAFRRWFQRP